MVFSIHLACQVICLSPVWALRGQNFVIFWGRSGQLRTGSWPVGQLGWSSDPNCRPSSGVEILSLQESRTAQLLCRQPYSSPLPRYAGADNIAPTTLSPSNMTTTTTTTMTSVLHVLLLLLLLPCAALVRRTVPVPAWPFPSCQLVHAVPISSRRQ